MTKLKLTYFDFDGGRGEPARLILTIGGIPFEDERINPKDWPAFRDKTPFLAMPVLHVDGKSITQSNSINRYTGKLAGLYPKDDVQALVVDEVMDAVEDLSTRIGNTIQMSDEAKKEAREDLASERIPRYLDQLQARLKAAGGEYFAEKRLTIADLNEMVVNAHINQADITRLKVGQKVDIHVESVPGLKLDGVLDRIAPQTTIKNNIKGYAARIVLEARDSRVLPGMTANLSIPLPSAENALAVPLAAVFTEQGERFVYVKKAGRFERRPVAIGVYDYDHAEVLSGLDAGEVVALEQPPDEVLAKLAKSPSKNGQGGGSARAGAGTQAAVAGSLPGTGGSTNPPPGGQTPAGRKRPGGT